MQKFSNNVARGSAVMWLAMYRPIWIASARSVTVLNDRCLLFPKRPENLLPDWPDWVKNLLLLATAEKKNVFGPVPFHGLRTEGDWFMIKQKYQRHLHFLHASPMGRSVSD